jgi:Arc/MetJ-type ribon-helix-helix transcriptional regulator
MAVTLDPATEQRIQRKIEQGHFRDSAEVIARALDLLDSQEDWFTQNRDALNERIEESRAQIRRGESYTPQQARQILAQRRAQRAG